MAEEFHKLVGVVYHGKKMYLSRLSEWPSLLSIADGDEILSYLIENTHFLWPSPCDLWELRHVFIRNAIQAEIPLKSISMLECVKAPTVKCVADVHAPVCARAQCSFFPFFFLFVFYSFKFFFFSLLTALLSKCCQGLREAFSSPPTPTVLRMCRAAHVLVRE